MERIDEKWVLSHRRWVYERSNGGAEAWAHSKAEDDRLAEGFDDEVSEDVLAGARRGIDDFLEVLRRREAAEAARWDVVFPDED